MSQMILVTSQAVSYQPHNVTSNLSVVPSLVTVVAHRRIRVNDTVSKGIEVFSDSKNWWNSIYLSVMYYDRKDGTILNSHQGVPPRGVKACGHQHQLWSKLKRKIYGQKALFKRL